MTSQVNIFSSKFEVSDSINLNNIDLSADKISVPTVHQVVKAILMKKRQGTHSTKNRSNVSGGGAKPFKQKGTGRARQGSNRSPVMVGGGVAFGPTPRDHNLKVNKKMMHKAILSVFADKLNEGKLFVVEEMPVLTKTSEAYKMLESKSLLSSLFVFSDEADKLALAIRNIKTTGVISSGSFNVYEALKYENLVIDKKSFLSILERVA